ncbi:MAG: hypothetical protein AABW50_01955 [Nanoarchaeota archaeon]
MKKWVIFGFLFMLLLIVLFSFKISERGNPLGEAISGQVGLNITIIQPTPTLTLHSPKNNTYLTERNLLLNFTKSADSVWYKIDSSTNITVTGPINFNTTLGNHTLFIYANNSNSTISRNVTFYVNVTHFIIIDSKFDYNWNGSWENENMSWREKKGETTNFANYSYEDFQNISDLKFEKTSTAKIWFREQINLTNDLNPNDKRLDINNNINISFNRIELNSTTLPNFNKSATLSLYNLTFANPRILKNEEICSESVCKIISYSDGILEFNVSHFTVYSTEETTSTTNESSTATSSTSESGGSSKIENFTIDAESIKVKLNQGESIEREMKIKNVGKKRIKINLRAENIEESVIFKENNFEIDPNEERTAKINFTAYESITPSIYSGKIIADSGKIKKEILVAVEIEKTIEEGNIYSESKPKGYIYKKIVLYSIIPIIIILLIILYKLKKTRKKPKKIKN